MSRVVDRRGQSKNTDLPSRRRFIDRHKRYVKKAVNRSLSAGNITDIGRGGVDVTIPKEDVKEPTIHHGKDGTFERVFPGNKEYRAGDRVPKQGGGGGGKKGSKDGEGEDDFIFHISEDEFLNIIFEDLELPNLTKRTDARSTETKPKRAGFVSQGPFAKLDLARSKRKKMERVLAASTPYNDQIIALLREERDILENYQASPPPDAAGPDRRSAPSSWVPRVKIIETLQKEIGALKDCYEAVLQPADAARIAEIESEVSELESRKKRIPKWNESTDLKFRFHEQKPVPTTKAVMFCLMDVSASMDQETKDQAKLFFFMLYRFLQRHYEQTDIVFIRHHSVAEEVNEEDFFYKRETGGTVVSTALVKMLEIIQERYPAREWNIYGAQASDGENFSYDNPDCEHYLGEILEKVQGYFYTELTESEPDELWDTYEGLRSQYPDRFWMGQIQSRRDIWPVFREFFKKRDKVGSAFQAGLPEFQVG